LLTPKGVKAHPSGVDRCGCDPAKVGVHLLYLIPLVFATLKTPANFRDPFRVYNY
tara:strand:- start:120 stop:284 length:165 start_codon:yes stop_codon:yes gene_type:complete